MNYDTKHSSPCLLKAEDGEPIFVLRGQDESAPAIITAWLALNPRISDEKRDRAVATRAAMLGWPRRKKAD